MISEYNAEPHAVNNAMQIIWKELRVSGFIVGSLYDKVRVFHLATSFTTDIFPLLACLSKPRPISAVFLVYSHRPPSY